MGKNWIDLIHRITDQKWFLRNQLALLVLVSVPIILVTVIRSWLPPLGQFFLFLLMALVTAVGIAVAKVHKRNDRDGFGYGIRYGDNNLMDSRFAEAVQWIREQRRWAAMERLTVSFHTEEGLPETAPLENSSRKNPFRRSDHIVLWMDYVRRKQMLILVTTTQENVPGNMDRHRSRSYKERHGRRYLPRDYMEQGEYVMRLSCINLLEMHRRSLDFRVTIQDAPVLLTEEDFLKIKHWLPPHLDVIHNTSP